MEEPRNPDDIDVTIRGSTERDYDKPAEEFVPGPPPSNESEIGKGKVRARRAVPPLAPRRTRARSRSLLIQPEAVPAVSRTTSRVKEKAGVAIAATAAMEPVPESQGFDEFVAYSDDGDEGEMHEVEADLQITAHSRGSYYGIIISPCFDSNGIYTTESPVGNQMYNDRRAEDLHTSRHVQMAPRDAAIASFTHDDLDDSDSDTELFEHVNKLSVLAPPVPAADLNKSGRRNRDQQSSSEEIFPSPGTRAGAEKKRRTQAAKAAPYVPPKGTRAASMVEKEQARSRQVAVTTQIKR